ncbi:tyrosine-type recombinase/integrase [Streptomyces sp. L2]|uniref:tyrosine-type recombinase/integrase n=1 Tax=Streptomyces sp. L2 TaxID=2162665 RepID=UPI0010135650|nr:tyrosine-type recombinase/integrase [Streptomyces sp. L2]
MSGGANLPGAAHLVLAGGVVHLDPESATFQAMLDGWELQQRARFLNHEATIAPRLRLVRRFAEFTNEYPWQWQPSEAEAFLDHLRSRKPDFAFSTARGYQNALRMFCDYITDARYCWPGKCLDSFGQVPTQIFHEWNAIVHTSDYEGRPGRRPLTYDEVQALFDAADGRAEEIRARGKKGALAAMRDSTALKVIYAYGLRRQEACCLDLSDLRRNPKVLDYGRCGALFVRYGKASKGSPPKRRTVLTVPEFDWVVDVLNHYLDEVRPAFLPGKHPALWITERRGRLSLRRLDEAFETARAAAGISEDLDLHSLRHSYVTHLLEFDYPERFVQDQVGHEYASTTAIYSGVSDDYRNRLVRKSLEARHAVLWESGSD